MRLSNAVLACADALQCTVYPRIGSLAVRYAGGECGRGRVLERLTAIDAQAVEAARSDWGAPPAPRAEALIMDVATLAGAFLARRWLLPAPVRAVWTAWRCRRFLAAALRSPWAARGWTCRSSTPRPSACPSPSATPRRQGPPCSFWIWGKRSKTTTRARSESELVHTLLPHPRRCSCGGRPRKVRAGFFAECRRRGGGALRHAHCIDGVVERGCATVNQSTLTGEPLAVERRAGDDVFAGTAVEDGELFVRVRAGGAETKLRSIVALVEQSEQCKAEAQSRRERLAERIVPWNFLLAGVVAATTRSLQKTAAALMVDYSCALKLTASISVLSAMSQSAKAGFTVKGSKHFEAFAQADAIVFDKTGTLTEATPEVHSVVAFNGWNRAQVLRFAACLEEHFPHPVARAVVRAAERRNLKHRERHANVEYLVAHGHRPRRLTASAPSSAASTSWWRTRAWALGRTSGSASRGSLRGCRSCIWRWTGSWWAPSASTTPLKEGAREAVARLRALGFRRVVMLTGDHECAAARVAREAGIDEYARTSCLKTSTPASRRCVPRGTGRHGGRRRERLPGAFPCRRGRGHGAGNRHRARGGDITLSDGSLESLVRLRVLSRELMRRLDRSFWQVMGVNSALLTAGVGGLVTPQASSLLHNGTTITFARAEREALRPSRRQARRRRGGRVLW